jgi:hypothetical protein
MTLSPPFFAWLVAVLEIRNMSGQTVCDTCVSRPRNPDCVFRMRSPLPDGQSYLGMVLRQGTYNIVASDCSGQLIDSVFWLNVDGPTTWTIEP